MKLRAGLKENVTNAIVTSSLRIPLCLHSSLLSYHGVDQVRRAVSRLWNEAIRIIAAPRIDEAPPRMVQLLREVRWFSMLIERSKV
jgi:hypothetical protein